MSYTQLPRAIRVDNTGSSDASVGIMNAIEWLGETQDDYAIGYETGRTKRLILPDGIYRIDNEITWDSDIAVDFGGEAFHGAELRNNTGGNWIINCEGGGIGTNLAVRNLLLYQGGINLWERWRGELLLDGLRVVETPSWGITFQDGALNEPGGNDLGPVHWKISNSQLYQCGLDNASGALGIIASTYLLGLIERVRFIDNTGTSLLVDGPGVSIDWCDFTRITRTSTARSHIWFRGQTDATSLSVVSRCRFGRESSLLEKVPEACIEFNDVGGAGTVSAVGIRENWFMGVQTPAADEGDTVLLVHKKPINISLLPGNFIAQDEYRTTIKQDWVANPASPSGSDTAARRCFIYPQQLATSTGTDIKVDNGGGTIVGSAAAAGWTVVA